MTGFYRLAQAFINIGDKDNAGAAIEAGLVNDPRESSLVSFSLLSAWAGPFCYIGPQEHCLGAYPHPDPNV